jgi:formate C-acetyltransferase
MPNAADSLLAIKKAVFDDKICTAHELVEALKANFKGSEQLRLKLRALPKYGRQHEEADEMARRLMTDICAIFSSYRNRWGGNGKPVILTFIWAPEAGAMLGATADGNPAGKPVAQGITPQSTSMTLGITAAMNSCLSMPFPLFGGGASTMWDLDTAWASEEIIRALLMTFVKNGGQIFQGNTTDVKSLLEAQKNPDEYGHLIVRVGGYSASFVNLSQELQNDIITRIRHAQ